MTRFSIIALCLTISLTANSASANKVPAELAKKPDGSLLSSEDIIALEKGTIFTHFEDRPSTPVKAAHAIALVDASPEDVFAVLTDYDHFDAFMPYCERVTILEHGEADSKVRFELDFPWPVGNRYYTLNLSDRREEAAGGVFYSSRWTYEAGSGNINDTYGAWEVLNYDDKRSFLCYTVFTDPGGKIPLWVRNKATASAVPKVINQLRQTVANAIAEEKAK